MRIALVQQFATPDKTANVRRGLAALETAAARGANLVCFAELAFEPFHPQRPARGEVATLAEPVPGPTTAAFQARARELGIVVVLNLFEREGARTYDCSPVIDADGRLLGRTRMLHITDYAMLPRARLLPPGRYRRARVRDRARTASGSRFATTGIIRSTCARWRSRVPRSSSCPRRVRSAEWPDGLYEGEMRVAAFQNGYFVALCNRVGAEECLTFAGESFVAAPDGTVVARAGRRRIQSGCRHRPRCAAAIARAAIVLARPPARAVRGMVRDRRQRRCTRRGEATARGAPRGLKCPPRSRS